MARDVEFNTPEDVEAFIKQHEADFADESRPSADMESSKGIIEPAQVTQEEKDELLEIFKDASAADDDDDDYDPVGSD